MLHLIKHMEAMGITQQIMNKTIGQHKVEMSINSLREDYKNPLKKSTKKNGRVTYENKQKGKIYSKLNSTF